MLECTRRYQTKARDKSLYSLILSAVLVLSVILIITIMLQPSKQNSAASAFTGGADNLFGKQKARGFEAVMKRSTAILGTIWMVLLFVLVLLSSQ
ncbi:preprotein translocase SecG subunit [Tetragenococcus halophilus subsp. halophilus]|nr:preprotein translocase SecG subunit [Tetragenococcus halophilus subsp. halophilus]GBD82972.1 preprotein translocase SecG subunit [Tetragenococcus halophilus subsp. halophilus]